jgi:hypothetical protein
MMGGLRKKNSEHLSRKRPSGKTPAEELTRQEFQATFRHTSRNDLLFMHNEQLQIHKLSTLQRTVFIIYIPKIGSSTAILRYRKITLLNAVNLTYLG